MSKTEVTTTSKATTTTTTTRTTTTTTTITTTTATTTTESPTVTRRFFECVDLHNGAAAYWKYEYEVPASCYSKFFNLIYINETMKH